MEALLKFRKKKPNKGIEERLLVASPVDHMENQYCAFKKNKTEKMGDCDEHTVQKRGSVKDGLKEGVYVCFLVCLILSLCACLCVGVINCVGRFRLLL